MAATVTSYRVRIASAISIVALGGSLLGAGVAQAHSEPATHSDTSAPNQASVAPAQPYGTVTARSGLNVREYPTTHADSLRVLRYQQQVGLSCWDESERVGNTRVWYKLRGQRGWVTAYYIRVTGHVPKCPNSSSSNAQESEEARG
jgi:hypothetical protein